MLTNFTILSGRTIYGKGYSWDMGAPLGTWQLNSSQYTSTTADTTVSDSLTGGLSPAFRVFFTNNSSFETGAFVSLYSINSYKDYYEWNFGDYYNQDTNIFITDKLEQVDHTYTMPGTYTVTLKHTRTTSKNLMSYFTFNHLGVYNINWFWKALNFPLNYTGKTARYAKQWADETACYGKYCSYWNWVHLKANSVNPYTWADTKSIGPRPKRWMMEGNTSVCNNAGTDEQTVTKSIEQVVSKQVVTVTEIPPTAVLSLSSISTGSSPLTVVFTSKNTRAGSFPIDRIDWNFGDGTPIITVTRYDNTFNRKVFKRKKYYLGDINDPRNFDVQHTYIRNKNQSSTYTASITAFSSSTGTASVASLNIGPINLPSLSSASVNLLKVRNTEYGNMYVLDVEGFISFFKTDILYIPPVSTSNEYNLTYTGQEITYNTLYLSYNSNLIN